MTAAGDALIQSGARVREMVEHVQTWRFDVMFGRVFKIPKPCGCRKCRRRQLDRALARVLDDSEPGAWAEALKFPPFVSSGVPAGEGLR